MALMHVNGRISSVHIYMELNPLKPNGNAYPTLGLSKFGGVGWYLLFKFLVEYNVSKQWRSGSYAASCMY